MAAEGGVPQAAGDQQDLGGGGGGDGEADSESEKEEEEDDGPIGKDARPQGPTLVYEIEDKHTDEGTVLDREGIMLYQTGPSGTGCGVVVLSDFWGWNSGRARAFADYLGKSLCTLTIMPRLLDKPPLEGGTDEDGLPPTFDKAQRGKELRPWLMRYVWNNWAPKIQGALTELRNSGVKRIACVGFCFGAWALCRVCSSIGELVCSAMFYPSFEIMEEMLYGSVPKLISQVCGPVLLFPASDDDSTLYGPEGKLFEHVFKSYRHEAECWPFEGMTHDWMLRGDVGDPKVKAVVEKAALMTAKYMRKFLWPPPVGANAATLRLACQEGDADVVLELLSAGIPAGGKDARDTVGLLPIHYAAKSQTSVYHVKTLMEYEADVNEIGGIAWEAAIHVAAGIGNTKAVKALLQARAEIEKADKGGQTALHIACRNGYISTVRLLIRAKASMYAKDKPSEQTPIHLAAWFGQEDIVVLMLKVQMEVDPIDLRHQTPQKRAKQQGFDALANIIDAERKRREDEAFFAENPT